MNRRERKRMEKQFGISKYKKKMSRAQRFENMRENILHGKELEAKMQEVRRVQEQKKSDDNSANRIASIATDLIVNKEMDYVTAMEEAKKIYQAESENQKK